MARNPAPNQISPATWEFWELFAEGEPSARLGGIYADKPGYHNVRTALPQSDYSVGEVAADRQGPAWAAGVDFTMSAEAMRKYTARLDVAARARDPRLYIGGEPVLREFIGTRDSVGVYCYVLAGGRARGLTSDVGPDYSRDSSHLWHLHLSFIRKFSGDRRAHLGVLAVLLDRPLDDVEEDMARGDDLWNLLFDGKYPAGVSPTHGGGIDRSALFARLQAIQSGIGAILKGINTDNVDEAEIARLVLAGMEPETLAGVIPDEIAEAVADKLRDRLAG